MIYATREISTVHRVQSTSYKARSFGCEKDRGSNQSVQLNYAKDQGYTGASSDKYFHSVKAAHQPKSEGHPGSNVAFRSPLGSRFQVTHRLIENRDNQSARVAVCTEG